MFGNKKFKTKVVYTTLKTQFMMLKLSYLGLTVTMLIILFFIGNYAINKSVSEQKIKNKKKGILAIGLLIWQLYIYLLASSGFLADFSFPPRFVLFMILPAFIFIGIFLNRNKKMKWIQTISPIWLTIYQSFRIIIETLFVYSVAAGILHKNVTIQGYNYDMFFAYTAPIIAFIIYKSNQLPKQLLLVWNYLGLLVIAVIIFLFITTIYFPEIYGTDTTAFPTEFG
ncbi:MAG TPA: hypothetical protein ENJ53_08070, partial [Phaeodactylibacter sp.]|nr:hypothetical protein [Phaeodactylibacter sp.]